MLTTEEVLHFAVHGYVVKRKLVDVGLTRRAVDVVWETMPPPFLRDQPDTWTGPLSDCRGTMSMHDRYGLVKFRKEVISEGRVAAVTTGHAAILDCAKALLGEENMTPPRKFRGLYPIFPTPEHAGVEVNGHIDETPEKFRISVGVYLNDLPADGGQLLIWPKSHRSLHFAALTTGCTYGDLATETFLHAYRAWNRSAPVALQVNTGDVVFLHYRLLHCPGLNLVPGHLRLAAYFNIRAKNDTALPPLDLWDGWAGLRRLKNDTVARTETAPVSVPKSSAWPEARRSLPRGGAFEGFARMLEKTVRAGTVAAV